MNFLPSTVKKGALFGLLLFLSHISLIAQDGKNLFSANCATCHALDKQLTGPALRGVNERGPWTDRKELHKWVHNPGGYIPTTEYTKNLAASFGGQIMPSFPQLSDKEIDAIADWIKTAPPPGGGAGTVQKDGQVGTESGGNSELLFGLVSIVLAIVALILMQVNSNLKKLSDDKEQILRPDPVPFWRNKIYIAMFAVLFFIVGGFFVAKSAIGLGRQRGYQPTQPIYFSHKVHAGVNQINCLYCHGSAWESKHAGIPTLNICMNCHKAINEYAQGPKIFDEEGREVNGTREIAKLYEYAGFTPGPGAQWDPAKGKSPAWVKIHNLPDHVYFNHAQHTKVGGVQCQNCHGNIQEMDKVYQASELSMGWCINCHRESKVQFAYNDSTGNRFYSIYEKFHNDLNLGAIEKVRRDGNLSEEEKNEKINELVRTRRMDSVRVKDIGGLECQKCHY